MHEHLDVPTSHFHSLAHIHLTETQSPQFAMLPQGATRTVSGSGHADSCHWHCDSLDTLSLSLSLMPHH